MWKQCTQYFFLLDLFSTDFLGDIACVLNIDISSAVDKQFACRCSIKHKPNTVSPFFFCVDVQWTVWFLRWEHYWSSGRLCECLLYTASIHSVQQSKRCQSMQIWIYSSQQVFTTGPELQGPAPVQRYLLNINLKQGKNLIIRDKRSGRSTACIYSPSPDFSLPVVLSHSVS